MASPQPTHLDLDQLVAFERVAREGSFTRAALALGLGQPAVSARIHALEAAVGGALFRRGRRIALTPVGEAFLATARRVVEVLGEGLEAARLTQAGRRGRLRLAALGSLAGGLVAPAVGDLIRARPEAECALKAAAHEQVVQLLLDDVVELALITWPCRESVMASVTPLLVFHEPVVLVAHPEHLLARRGVVAAADLARWARPLLRLRWWPAHHPEITRLADASGTSVDVPMEIARDLVLHGIGAGFFTRTYIAADLAEGRLKEIGVRDLPPLFRDSALVRRARPVPLSPLAAHAAERIHAHARRLGLVSDGSPARRTRRAVSSPGRGPRERQRAPVRVSSPRRPSVRRG